jgi:hypothetical protein
MTGLTIKNNILKYKGSAPPQISGMIWVYAGGYYLKDSHIYNNIMNTSSVTYFGSDYPENILISWNTTKTTGTNIIGGSQIGGNYWTFHYNQFNTANYTGYSVNCTNTNNDSFCDSPYTIYGKNLTGLILNQIDYLPLTIEPPTVPPTPLGLLGNLGSVIALVVGAGILLLLLGILLESKPSDPKPFVYAMVGVIIIVALLTTIL